MSYIACLFCLFGMINSNFLNGANVPNINTIAIIGNKEIVINEGMPMLVGPRTFLARDVDGNIKYRISGHSTVKFVKINIADLNSKERRKLDEDSKRYSEKFDIGSHIKIVKSGSWFSSNVLRFDGEVINTHGKSVSVIREAYLFEGGVLATIQAKGNAKNDGPVEIMFIDTGKKEARFLFYGEKIYWRLMLVEASD